MVIGICTPLSWILTIYIKMLMIREIIQFNCHRSLDNFNFDLIWRYFCSQCLCRLACINWSTSFLSILILWVHCVSLCLLNFRICYLPLKEYLAIFHSEWLFMNVKKLHWFPVFCLLMAISNWSTFSVWRLRRSYEYNRLRCIKVMLIKLYIYLYLSDILFTTTHEK